MTVANITNLIVACATLITAITLLLKAFPQGKKIEAIQQVATATQELVNGKNTDLINRTVQLEQELTTNQIPVPPDPSVPINSGKVTP